METIRFLLGKIVLLVPVLLIAGLMYWIGAKLVPFLPASFTKPFSETETGTSTPKKNKDWLPAPRNFSGLLKGGTAPIQNEYVPNEYSPNAPYAAQEYAGGRSAGVNYVTYDTYTTGQNTKTTSKTTATSTFNAQQSGFAQTELYIRNLSLYRGGALYSGMTFSGEAKEVMFTGSRIQILVIDQQRRVIGAGEGMVGSQWAIPGWKRFDAKITTPIQMRGACGLIFRSTTNPLAQVLVPMTCSN